MLSKIDQMVRQMVMGQENEPEIPTDLQGNPLIGYLKLFRNQHKVITVLYKGLITAFTGFVLLLSLLILNVLQNKMVPAWGAILLTVTDLLLLYGVYRAFRELHNYRDKSSQITDQIYDYLKKDLTKLGKLKLGNGQLRDTPNRRKGVAAEPDNTSSVPVKSSEYRGWDSKRCSHCGAIIEMLAEACPVCRHGQEKYLEN